MNNRRIFVGDFETTVYDNQLKTEVWASSCVELFTEDVKIFHSIWEQFDYFKSLKSNIICYYHNLKFDGSFWIAYLIQKLKYKQAYTILNKETGQVTWNELKEMPNNSFQYSVSNMGQWYRIIIKTSGKIIELRDSFKLLPFSVERIGKSFGTKHKKLNMDYKGYRYAGCEITDEEKKYIANDVLVVKEALEILYSEGHDKLTIGACCLNEFKKSLDFPDLYDKFFPNLYEIPINQEEFGYPTAGDYIRASYRGGWCYLVRGKENKIFHNGTTADVNSLYPSMMSSESGNYYPTGHPIFWKGDYIPDEATKFNRYYFVRFKTRFYIKPNKLPFIQIKHSMLYKSTEMLETSDVYDIKTNKYYSHYKDFDGNIVPATVTLTMTMTDFTLMQEHYDLVDCQILDGCYFITELGLFDEYIEKYKKIKVTSKGAKRELAKLFLNNLYGKMASSKCSSFKVAYEKEDKSIGFYTVEEYDKQPGYIAIGSAITSYARNFTIRAAQKNYHGVNQRGFIYADTDSIHCDLEPDEIQGIKEDKTAFCCWKLESCWDEGFFCRQKTYIEHITHEDREQIEKPFYNIKCAGMPERCKELFNLSMQGYQPSLINGDYNKYTPEEREFLKTKRTINDFTIGLNIPGKLLPKRIEGGVVLMDVPYEMR